MATLRESILVLAGELLAHPTAPFREDAVRCAILNFCRQRQLAVTTDAVGNLRVLYGREYGRPVMAFAAHMDHPGFMMTQDAAGKRVEALFYGGVAESYFQHARVTVFTDDGPVDATVLKTAFDRKRRRVWLRPDGPVRAGDLGMWALPACRVRGDRLYSRACDDLIGCVSVLALLEQLHRRRWRKPVQAIFTVAEEAGLQGAKHLCLRGGLSRQTPVVAIETSSALPTARIGDGVVVRVGDASSVFTPAMTAFLVETAQHLAARETRFRFQRKLMDGGTCESTIYHRFGYPNAAVCIPLGHYHNQNRRTGRIAAEVVSVSDLENMVRLFLAAVQRSGRVGAFLNAAPPVYRKSTGKHGEFFYT